MSRFARRMQKLRREPMAYLLDSKHALLKGVGQWLFTRETARFLILGEQAASTKISVIMTAYNTGHLIERAVRSVLAQSHENLELMVIDDASTDDTAKILAALAKEDPRVRVFSSPSNHGTYWSKNWCLAKASGEFVAFHDSDDYSDADRLRVQLGAFMAHPDLKACTCRWRRVNEQGEAQMIDGAAERMAAISLMIKRRDVLEQAGFFDTVRIAADTEFIRRLRHIFGERGVRHLRQCLYTGLLREGSLTTGENSGFAWKQEGNAHKRSVGGDREAYYNAFTDWHAACGRDRAKLSVTFPLRHRPFDVPAAMQKGCNDEDLSQVVELDANSQKMAKG
ncbi:MAG: glycosyltransferase family 2 protein [Oceanospirillaceae bacterium]|nr:glycosyltransferase family 2 protein [Oceanospirillaceae bacterium]